MCINNLLRTTMSLAESVSFLEKQGEAPMDCSKYISGSTGIAIKPKCIAWCPVFQNDNAF